MKWERSEVAQTWEEGCIVVVHKIDRPRDNCGAYKLTQWFRPDFVENEHGYGMGSHILYLKLAEPT